MLVREISLVLWGLFVFNLDQERNNKKVAVNIFPVNWKNMKIYQQEHDNAWKMPEKVMRKVVSDTLTKRFLLNRERKRKT